MKRAQQPEVPAPTVEPVAVHSSPLRPVEPGEELERPDNVYKDTVLYALRRSEDIQISMRLIIFGLLVVQTISSLCLLFILLYLIYN